jgi:hypothetical protein
MDIAELRGDGNPFLQGPGLSSLRTWVTRREELVKALAYEPWAGLLEKETPAEDRLLMVSLLRNAFVPCPDSVSVAEGVLRLIFDQLRFRDPRRAENQRWVNSTAQWLGQSVDQIPWHSSQAQGMVVEGITGVGKSHAVDRALQFLPQVVDHEPMGQWGMLKLRQLVWLKVEMPADYTRMGLLIGILKGMDDVLGTNYRALHVSSRARVHELIVTVMHLLVQHRCGILVIEEAQEQSLGVQAYSKEFLNYFLKILNWGIPVLLVGNPLAFQELKTHAQDVDRFSEGGWMTLLPEQDCRSRVWSRLWMRGIWGANLLEQPDAEFTPVARYPGVSSWSELLWLFTGGLPRHLNSLRREVLDVALRKGIDRITSALVADVFDSSWHFSEVRARNMALATHDLKALMGFKDMPIDQLRRHWAKGQGVSSAAASSPDPMTHGAPGRSQAPGAGEAVTPTEPDEAAKTLQRQLCADLRAVTRKPRSSQKPISKLAPE